MLQHIIATCVFMHQSWYILLVNRGFVLSSCEFQDYNLPLSRLDLYLPTEAASFCWTEAVRMIASVASDRRYIEIIRRLTECGATIVLAGMLIRRMVGFVDTIWAVILLIIISSNMI